MGKTSAFVDAPPERVWEVLADAPAYGDWVVGSREIRRWDPEFPGVGTAFHHSVQIGPVAIRDSTSVLESEPPRRLVLLARARPLGVARIAFDLTPEGERTRVEIDEWPVEGPAARLQNPVQDWLIDRRNDASLRRLKRLAERR